MVNFSSPSGSFTIVQIDPHTHARTLARSYARMHVFWCPTLIRSITATLFEKGTDSPMAIKIPSYPLLTSLMLARVVPASDVLGTNRSVNTTNTKAPSNIVQRWWMHCMANITAIAVDQRSAVLCIVGLVSWFDCFMDAHGRASTEATVSIHTLLTHFDKVMSGI